MWFNRECLYQRLLLGKVTFFYVRNLISATLGRSILGGEFGDARISSLFAESIAQPGFEKLGPAVARG